MTLRAGWCMPVLAALCAASSAGCGGGGGGGTSGGPGGDGPPPASASQILVEASSPGALEDLCGRKGARVVGPVEGTDYYLVEVPPGAKTDDFRHEIENEFEVVHCELDEGTGAPEGGGSTVPIFLGDDVAAIASQPALTQMGVPIARGRGYRGAGVLVAVVDTGIVPGSPALAGHIAPGGRDFIDGDFDPSDVPNGLDDDGDGLIDEGVGHGTFVASLVLAVAPDAMILPIRALNSDAVGTASTVARAIAYAVSQGAKVINVSAGLTTSLVMIDQAIANAKAAGVPVVAAAGNRGLAQIDFPADLSDVTAVAAVDAGDRKASFSSYSSSVDVSAPGVDVIGAFPGAATGTARWSGTSFSTALATGAFALMRGHDAVTQAKDLWKRLSDTAVPLDAVNPAFAGRLGRGRLDLGAATAP